MIPFKVCSLSVILNILIPRVFLATVIKIENFTVKYNAIYPAAENDILLQEKNYWMEDGLRRLKKNKKEEARVQQNVAKNVIIFIGDGMGVTTTTAARIYKGQRHFGKMGEEYELNFDKFPNVALAKTYSVDRQVPDSAATATALFTGVKARSKSLGVDVRSNIYRFDKEIYAQSKLDSFMVWAQAAGKDTGIVTTTRITHATPAATYARINHRDWECDTEIPAEYKNDIKDIGRQLIEDEPGKNYKVILGGGQQQMGYVNERTGGKCARGDGLNLTQIWIDNHRSSNAIFAVNNQDLDSVNDGTEYLLGLFDRNHMPLELVRNNSATGTPSLSHMTKKALQILSKNSNGFVLMVEGGLIDQAHHKNYARLALSETAEFDNAILEALKSTGDETLIIVTADHSHAFTMSGYPKRGNDILGFGNETMKENDYPYLTLAYGNGPGFEYHYNPNRTNALKFPWRDVTVDSNRLQDPWYPHLASFAKKDETHGGEDVPVYAKGPNSQLIKGVFEQNYIAHVISYAACIGPCVHLNQYCHEEKPTSIAIVLQQIAGLIIWVETNEREKNCLYRLIMYYKS